jgi:hypothetical protein
MSQWGEAGEKITAERWRETTVIEMLLHSANNYTPICSLTNGRYRICSTGEVQAPSTSRNVQAAAACRHAACSSAAFHSWQVLNQKHPLQSPHSACRRTRAGYSCAVRATACTDASVTPRAAASRPSKAAACTTAGSRELKPRPGARFTHTVSWTTALTRCCESAVCLVVQRTAAAHLRSLQPAELQVPRADVAREGVHHVRRQHKSRPRRCHFGDPRPAVCRRRRRAAAGRERCSPGRRRQRDEGPHRRQQGARLESASRAAHLQGLGSGVQLHDVSNNRQAGGC